MSSILKALKKLEHEKTVRKPDSFRIDADILRGGSPRRSFSSSVLLAAIAIFACGGGAAYLYLKHDKTSAPVQSPQSSKNEVNEPSTVTPLLPGATMPAAEPQLRTSVKVISGPEKLEYAPRSIEKQHVQRVKPVVNVPQDVTPEPKTASPFVPAAPVVITPVKPVLKVHGIAFQDGAESVAVINGITVSNGSVIEGARVEEIQKDRVIFSRSGERFEVILDKSN